jgi:membrane protein YqaA with SNARE-associated domain
MMGPNHLTAAFLVSVSQGLRRWLFHLGGIGLIPLGLLDNSPIPTPGAMDVALILLAARRERLWLYYALMAIVGSLIGGFVAYRLARKGGKETLELKFSRVRAERICTIFERWGFAAIVIPALLPPPVPMVPFLFAAGAMQYPVRKFLTALAIGRGGRYLMIAYFAARYGRRIVAFMARHGHPKVLVVVAIFLAVIGVAFYLWRRTRIRKAS